MPIKNFSNGVFNSKFFDEHDDKGGKKPKNKENEKGSENSKDTDSTPNTKKYDDQEVNAIVAKRLREEREKIARELEQKQNESKNVDESKETDSTVALKEIEKLNEKMKKIQEKNTNNEIKIAMTKAGADVAKTDFLIRMVDKAGIINDDTGEVDSSALDLEIKNILEVFPELKKQEEDDNKFRKIGADNNENPPDRDEMARALGLFED